MSAAAAKPQTLSVTRTELEDFLYQEAALLDEWRLEEWLAFTESPSSENLSGPGADLLHALQSRGPMFPPGT